MGWKLNSFLSSQETMNLYLFKPPQGTLASHLISFPPAQYEVKKTKPI